MVEAEEQALSLLFLAHQFNTLVVVAAGRHITTLVL